MTDLDVILAAHGAGNGSATNERLQQSAREIESALVGARVTAAFHLGEPTHYDAILAATRANRIVVPVVTSNGYYADRIRQDASLAAISGTRTRVLPPIGTHPLFIQVIADKVLAEVQLKLREARRCIVVVVGHGTPRHAGSAAATHDLAQVVARSGVAATYAAFIDAHPSIEDVLSSVFPVQSVEGATSVHVLIVPLLLGGGGHSQLDVPRRVAAVAEQLKISPQRITLLKPAGELAVLNDVIERAVRETRKGRQLLRVGARASVLSRRQVEMFAARVAPRGVDVQFVPIATLGDRDLRTPIHALGADDPFTGDINDALLTNEIDVAVHSLKDLPLARNEDASNASIVTAAILPRGSAGEVLVSQTGASLSKLSSGARIGTSCARRASQILRLRSDVRVENIRGAVPDRVAAVDRGEFDAVVLAAAGLERLNLTHRIAQQFSVRELVPAPGQGAIAVQCRATSPHVATLAAIDDVLTRHAVEAELAFARAVEAHPARERIAGRAGSRAGIKFVACAFAVADDSGIHLQARLINAIDHRAWDISVHGADAEHLGQFAAEGLLTMTGVGKRRTQAAHVGAPV